MTTAVIEEIVRHFDHLAARWSDEGEYEDFEEYQQAMRKFLEARDAALLEMTHTPMVLTFSYKSLHHRLEVKGSRLILKVRRQTH